MTARHTIRARASDGLLTPFGVYGDASVTHVDLAPHAGREAAAFESLHPDERLRWRRFIHPGARRRFTLCRAAIRAILCERLGCANSDLTFGEGVHEKPFALVNGSPAPISFNLSHGGSNGLIALADEGRIGVDVEERTHRRDFDRLIEAAFGVNEQCALRNARGDGMIHLFFRLWTIKEALIKALGTGLSFDPAEFEAPASMRRGASSAAYRFPQLPSIEWRVSDLGCEAFAAAVVHESGPDFSTLTDADVDWLLSRGRKR